MVAPMLELMATLRVLVVPWALPSRECEWDSGVLTVEAPICPSLCGRGSSLTDRPVGPAGLLLTVNSNRRTMTHLDSTVNSRHPCIFGLLPAGRRARREGPIGARAVVAGTPGSPPPCGGDGDRTRGHETGCWDTPSGYTAPRLRARWGRPGGWVDGGQAVRARSRSRASRFWAASAMCSSTAARAASGSPVAIASITTWCRGTDMLPSALSVPANMMDIRIDPDRG